MFNDVIFRESLSRALLSILISISVTPVLLSITAQYDAIPERSFLILGTISLGTTLIAWRYGISFALALWSLILLYLLISHGVSHLRFLQDFSFPLSTALFLGFSRSLRLPHSWILTLFAFALSLYFYDFSAIFITSLACCFLLGVSAAGFTATLISSIAEPFRTISRRRLTLLFFFLVSYFLSAFYFACLFYLLHHTSADSFTTTASINPSSLADWLFFSTYLLITGNLFGVSPDTHLAKLLVALATLVGVFWLVVYVSLLITSLQSRSE